MIIVAGTFRVPEDRVDELLPVARATLEATRNEDGCLVYSFAIDVEDGGLVHVYEEWQSRGQLDAHRKQPHMAPWRAKLAEIGASGRALKVYEADRGEPI